MPSPPGDHPLPPSTLARRNPTVSLRQQDWFRIFPMGHNILHFGRSAQNRFDAPGGAYEVVYLASDAFAAFIETLGQTTGIRAVTEEALRIRGLARVTTSRPLRAIDLFAPGGLARIGADARLVAGDYEVARQWSAALHDHPCKPDGILYPARHDPARAACAVFDHCRDLLQGEDLGSLLSDRLAPTVGAILDHYDIGLISS